MEPERKSAQLRIRRKMIIEEGCGGTIFWATPSRARLLLDAGAVDLMNAPGPSETKPAGPGETKDTPEKKSFAAVPAGRSTASAASSVPGAAASSPASVAAPASPRRKSSKSAAPAAA